MSTGTGVLDRLKRPEYTGENRCIPCTVTNLVLAAGLAVAVWFLLPAGVGPAVGVALFVVAAAAIYLRGYLVPGTPWFTRTYFPDWLLRAFDKHPSAGPTWGAAGGEIDVESALVDVGAVTECDDADDLCLTGEFREDWQTAVEAVRTEDARPRDLAATLGDGVVFEQRGETMVAREEDLIVCWWESEAALLADVAATRLLSDRFRGWADLDLRERGAVLTGLRLFVERCPSCDGPVTMGEEVVESCCRSKDVIAVACDDCGARLVETEVPEAA